MSRVGQFVSTRDRRDTFLEYLKTLGPGDDCVHWPWSDKRGDYVRLGLRDGTIYLHRWVWGQINGPIPPDQEVCHNCPAGDDPSCLRPSHLWLGTHSENIRDSYAKGRMHGNTKNHAKAEDHWRAVLTAEDVYRIRRLCDDGAVHNRLAKEYGVSRVTIGSIAKRQTWKSLPEEA